MRAALVLSVQVLWLMALALSGACSAAQPALRARSMPQGGSFTGVWFSPQYGEMHIVQNGAAALGRYAKDERTGRIQGRVEGDLLRFEWTEQKELIVDRPVQTKGHGYFRVLKDDAENTWKLVGEWGNDDAERGGGPWNAVRARNQKPQVHSHSQPDSSNTSNRANDTDHAANDLGDL